MRTSAVIGMLTTAATLSTGTIVGAQPAAHAAGSNVPSDVKQVRVKHSLLGTHTWYQQQAAGLPVVGGYFAVHDVKGASTTSDRRVAVKNLVSSKSRISPAAANKAAARHGVPRAQQLVVLPGENAKVVYEVATTGGKKVYVQASDGAVVKVVDERRFADASGRVFDPNPVVKTQNPNLQDSDDASGAVPRAAYKTVVLKRLDNSGYLRGSYARIINPTTGDHPAVKATKGAFNFNRNQDGFEQVNAYYAVDRVQSYLRRLGFRDANGTPQDLSVNTVSADNSWYTPSADTITFGTGGVDDAEDAEVVWHEYGHAVQDDQVPGFGAKPEGRAIGEGFGDYLAFAMSQSTSKNTAVTPWACVADWDSTSYTSSAPHCLRRLDTGKTVADKTGEEHDDGEIWSQALFDIDKGLGRDKAAKVIVEGQFSYTPDADFKQAAGATVSAARGLYGAAAAATVKAAFRARGIL